MFGKKQQIKEKFVRLCPRCGSADVVPSADKSISTWGSSMAWTCTMCDYNAVLFPEVSMDEVEDFRKGLKESDSG